MPAPPDPPKQHDDEIFAEAYADQNERDSQALVEAVKSGPVIAQQGL